MIQQRQNKYRLKMSEKSERENEIIYKIESSGGSIKGKNMNLEALTEPITKVLFEIKGRKRCLGGAHRVHFEYSLLHDSVTTIRVAPS